MLDPFRTAPASLSPTDLTGYPAACGKSGSTWKRVSGDPRLFKEGDRNLVDSGELLQLYEVNSPFSRFALGNKRLWLVEELRNFILSETGEPTGFLQS